MVNVWLRTVLYVTSKISLTLALVLTIITLVLTWVGLIVPDWLIFTSIDGIQIKFGLWSECKKVNNFNTQFNCQFWTPNTLPG